MIAHRYALSMSGVDTVILGVKNRAELEQCLDAEAAGLRRSLERASISRDAAMKATEDASNARKDLAVIEETAGKVKALAVSLAAG